MKLDHHWMGARTRQFYDYGIAMRMQAPETFGSKLGPSDPHSIVFVHGAHHGKWQWRYSQDYMSTHGRVSVAVDWYNHGDSRSLPNREFVRRGIEAVTNEVGAGVSRAPGRPVLMGHGAGAMASLLFAAANPSLVSALVLVAPVVPARFAEVFDSINVVNPNAPAPIPRSEVARQWYFPDASSEIRRAAYDMLRAESPRVIAQALNCEIDVEVKDVTMPALVVAGNRDPLAPYSGVRKMARAMSARMLTLEGAGHGLMFSAAWASTLAKVNDWTSQVLNEDPPVDDARGVTAAAMPAASHGWRR